MSDDCKHGGKRIGHDSILTLGLVTVNIVEMNWLWYHTNNGPGDCKHRKWVGYVSTLRLGLVRIYLISREMGEDMVHGCC